MKGDARSIDCLNRVLKDVLTAINQHFLHARIYRHGGLERLGGQVYRHSIVDMKQADELVERILFLEGLPNLQDMGKLNIGEDVGEMLQCDLSMNLDLRQRLVDSIAVCEALGDYVSRDLLQEMLSSREEIIDWLETQQHLLAELGKENYQQSQL